MLFWKTILLWVLGFAWCMKCPQKPKEVIKSHGTSVRGDCEHPCGCWEWNQVHVKRRINPLTPLITSSSLNVCKLCPGIYSLPAAPWTARSTLWENKIRKATTSLSIMQSHICERALHPLGSYLPATVTWEMLSSSKFFEVMRQLIETRIPLSQGTS